VFKKRKRNKEKKYKTEKKVGRFAIPFEVKQKILGILMLLFAILTSLSFFEKAGKGGELFMRGARFLIGEAVFLIPLIFLLGGLALLKTKKSLGVYEKERNIFWPVIIGIFVLIFSLCGFLGTFSPETYKGGHIGYILSWPLLKYFSALASRIIFFAFLIIGFLIIWHFLPLPEKEKEKEYGKDLISQPAPEKPSIIRRIFAPRFKVKEISHRDDLKVEEKKYIPEKKQSVPAEKGIGISGYTPPPLDLLEPDKGVPTTGDIKMNSAIIKKTLHDFGIEVTMSEVNIGPTVTQYTLKPAEGVKLSKITNLANNLSLALASHPIRIEAPIPGRSLVGIEVPNKERIRVRLRNLLENPLFQKFSDGLIIALGRDVSGNPVYADLSKMPHLLVAGSTGSGKTIFLNDLIISLLYQPTTNVKSGGPENLRFVLVDPKRVEFSLYTNLPHLLCPVIYDADKTVLALRWLIKEMERRFDVLSEVKARDIKSYNKIALARKFPPLPFIVVIIDELADLMAAKGREIEAFIVRLAQMARAVGIHLVVATQRPSVEVITGLIKANITTRITFQVASQVDSRTVLDTAGAEKLLGLGDMLYVSAQTPKPKRIQAPYISDKEIKRVVKYIISKEEEKEEKTEMERDLVEALEKEENGLFESGEKDVLYEQAKKIVLENKRASTSLLQRKLRIGYARAARLIDMLEEEGIIGPSEGAKPREVYGEPSYEEKAKEDDDEFLSKKSQLEEEEEGNWRKL